MIAEPRLRNVHHHRVAPVGLRDVEPESLQGFTDAVRRVRQQPERSKVPPVLKRSSPGADRRDRDDARLEHRPPAARRRQQEKDRIAGQQQDHREVVAEPEREDGEEQEQAASARHVRPPQEQQQRQRDEHDVKRVDLGDDRLAPERVGRRKKQRDSERSGNRSRQLGGHEHGKTAGCRALDCRREIQRVRRLRLRQPQHRRPDRKVQRVAVARRDQRRAHHRLKRSGVAEVDSRKEGRAVHDEGERRGGERGEQSAAAHGVTDQREARLAAMVDRTSEIDRAFSTCRGSTRPRRAVTMPRSI